MFIESGDVNVFAGSKSMKDNSKQKSRRGQWHKGVSGNPAGRPPGSRNKVTVALEALLEEGAEQLISKAMTMALFRRHRRAAALSRTDCSRPPRSLGSPGF